MSEAEKKKKIKKKEKTKKGIIIRIAVVAFVLYMCVVMINQQADIKQKEAELDSLNSQISVQDIENEQLREVLNSDQEQTQEYIEKIAREELGLSNPGERVYIGISGE